MISVGSRDGRRGLGLELEMEETELEEGEALSYNDGDEDSAIDPDIALSYIEEKLHNVLGHFQKDFEGSVSAENLGAKFGGYGSFLPTYQRSPSWSHARSQQEVLNSDSPRSPRMLHLEDRRQSSLALTSASPSARPCKASGRTSPMGDSLKEPSSKCGVVMKSVNPSDQRTLKVRLRVGSENLSTKKNAEIYSGLGLVSPSSSLDDSPATNEGPCGALLESPSNILKIMTLVPRDLLLSPLAEYLICLPEKTKPRVKSESENENNTSIESSAMLSNGFHSNRSNQKVPEHKKLMSSEKYDAFSNKTSYQENYGDWKDTGSLLKKEMEPDIDALGYEELVSNALKLSLLSSSEKITDDPVKRMSTPITVPVVALKDEVKAETFSKVTEKEHLHGECIQNISKGRKALAVEPTDPLKQGVVQKGEPDSEEGLNPAPENSSTGGKRKPKRVDGKSDHVAENQLLAVSSLTSKGEKSSHANGTLPKPDSRDIQKDHEKPEDRYKDFFGDVQFEEDDNESISGEMAYSETLKDTQKVRKVGLDEHRSTSDEKHDVKSSEKPRRPQNCMKVTADVAPAVGNGPSTEHPAAMDPLVNEEWVLCDKCGKWRLLPLDTNPHSLPDKWVCRMLTWLPGRNGCNIPEDVTTNALRALYHPAPFLPAKASESQYDSHKISVPISIGVTSVDAKHGQEHHTAKINNKKKKHGSINATYSTDIDGSTHSSNSRRKNLPSSVKYNNLNKDASRYQQIQQTNPDMDRPNDNKKDGKMSLVNSSDKGTNLKIKSKRKSDVDGSRDSKRIKGEELHDEGLARSRKSDEKKRKHKEYHGSQEVMRENGHQKEKKPRVPKSVGKETSGSKSKVRTERKSDLGSIQHSLAANSSSSKVSGSHKNKEDVKASPVESVSSSPLRLYNRNPDKVTSTGRNLVEKDDVRDSGSLTVVSSRKFSGSEDYEGNIRTGTVKKVSVLPANDQGNQYVSEKRASDHCQVEEIINTQRSQNSGSHSKKSGLDINTDKTKASDLSRSSLDHTPLSQDKSNSRRTKLDEKSGTPSKIDKFIVKKDYAQGKSAENSKEQIQNESMNHHGQDKIRSLDKKHNLDKELDAEKLPKKNNQAEVLGTKKTHSLPPLARAQGETVANLQPDSVTQKQNGSKDSAIDNCDALKVPKESKKAENQPVTSRQPTPNSHKGRDIEAPSPLRRDSSSHAANTAIKEAKDLKHLADRLKNNGSSESTGYYFQTVLKFLHGASLLESGSNERTKQNDMVHAMHIYSTTAKLCEYCAHEYEKSKDMAAAALAYKCTEVAYMRVVYSSHTSAIRDQNELQTALQVVPLGESPSSSASDVDNLNQQAITDKTPLAKVLVSPQVSGSHIISSQNRAGFLRLLNFAQEVNFAMEASRKSRISYTAAISRLGETPHREGVTSLKKVLDFNFQDVEGLLRLVRVAMEAIGR